MEFTSLDELQCPRAEGGRLDGRAGPAADILRHPGGYYTCKIKYFKDLP